MQDGRVQQRGNYSMRKLQTCSSNRALCSNGSFNSVYALQNSFPHMNPSKRSHRPGRDRCHLASGDMIWGCPTDGVKRIRLGFNGLSIPDRPNSPMNAGLTQSGSINSPTSCNTPMSSSMSTLLNFAGALPYLITWRLFLAHCSLRCARERY